MKYIKLLLVVFLSNFIMESCLNAQDVRLTNAERLSNEITHFDVLGKIEERIILFKYGKNYFELNAFDDNDMDLVWSREINFKHKRPLMIEMLLTPNGAIAFYSTKQNGSHILYGQPLNKNLKLVGEPILINDADNRNFIYRINHNISRSHFAIEIIDKTALNGTEKINVLVLDGNLQQISATQLDNRTGWKFRKSLLGLNGELFLLSESKQTGLFADEDLISAIKINKKLPNFSAQELTYQKAGLLFIEYIAELNHTSSQLVLSGTFSKSNNEIPDGYFFTNFDYAVESENLVANIEKFEILPNTLQTQTTRKSILGNRNRLEQLRLEKLMVRTDGGAVLMGELFSKSVVTPMMGGGLSSDIFAGRSMQTTTHNYDDIVIVSLNNLGEVEWTEVLHKEQYSENDGGHFSSFGVFNSSKKLSLIFNEEIGYSSAVSSFVLSEKGSSNINTLFNSEKYDVLVSPRYAKQVAKNEVIIPAYTTRNYFVLVQLVY